MLGPTGALNKAQMTPLSACLPRVPAYGQYTTGCARVLKRAAHALLFPRIWEPDCRLRSRFSPFAKYEIDDLL